MKEFPKILNAKNPANESYEVDFPFTSSYKILCIDVSVINQSDYGPVLLRDF